MKKIKLHHTYSVTVTDEIEIPDDFEVRDSYLAWGVLTLYSKDGREIEFESKNLDYADLDIKRPTEYTVEDVRPLKMKLSNSPKFNTSPRIDELNRKMKIAKEALEKAKDSQKEMLESEVVRLQLQLNEAWSK